MSINKVLTYRRRTLTMMLDASMVLAKIRSVTSIRNALLFGM